MPTLDTTHIFTGTFDRWNRDKVVEALDALNAAVVAAQAAVDALEVTPVAHAANHQNGGADEIAVATAAANAIPKAGAGATLAAGWIPDLGQVAGVAAGYKLARGTGTPDATPYTIVTGLATVIAAVAVLKGAPTVNCMGIQADVGDQAGTPAAGSIYIRTTKPTAVDNVTPIDATAWSTIDWIAIGT